MLKIAKNIISSTYKEVINFVIPPICLSCDKPLDDGYKYLCKNCEESIVKINNSNGTVLDRLNSSSTNGLIKNAYSLYLFQEGTPIQTLIHALKYKQMTNIGKYYATRLAEILSFEKLSADFVIPVPLHISKKRERGYNQSDYICDGFTKVLKISSLKKCLKRKKFTETQTKLSREERIQNVRGAFDIRKKYKTIIQGKSIIITDDVITTGSTILECANVLKESGCSEITVCSLALAE